MNRESSLFQEISKELILDIIKEHFQTDRLLDYKLMEGGMFNTTYKLTIGEPQQMVILRLGPINQHLLMEFEKHLMEAEMEVYERCRDKKLPFPNVLVMDISRRLFDRDYMITEYIDSIAMSSAKVTGEEKTRIYRETGRYASIMHTITSDTFGFVYDCMNGKGYSSWYLFLMSFITNILESSRQFNAFSDEEIQDVYDVFIKNKELLDQINTPHLLHCDLWDGNILLKEESGNFSLAAIIDGDRAVYGDIDFEFASGWMVNQDFLLGYGIDQKEYQSEKRVARRKIYEIVYVLIEAYVGIAEYNREEAYLNGRKRIREMVQELR